MKKRIYFSSDWHVGHKNVLKFDNRPFSTLEEMHEALIKNFNHYVPKHGVTYFLGDMGICSHGLLKSVITRLNGTKILVSGNHDGNMYSMYEAGFDVVTNKAQINIGKNIVTMSHCPLYGVFREDTTGMRGCTGEENWHNEEKFKDRFSFYDFGQYHLHGHIHAGPHNGKKRIDGRQMDVGVAANKYKPVSISEVESWIARHKKAQFDDNV